MEADSPAGLPRIPGGASPAGGVGGSGPRYTLAVGQQDQCREQRDLMGKEGLSFQLDLEQARENL